MLDEAVGLGAVTVLGVLEQAYFSLQVIYARRKYSVSPPATTGPPEFERVFRAQANCSEYFPIFITVLWTAGVFFSQGDVHSQFTYLHKLNTDDSQAVNVCVCVCFRSVLSLWSALFIRTPPVLSWILTVGTGTVGGSTCPSVCPSFTFILHLFNTVIFTQQNYKAVALVSDRK
uniref:Leukotriene C4 synthase n=1 Tax=Lates calcarifer TaxID=8187 RepID=A0A4W6CQ89_LATCA